VSKPETFFATKKKGGFDRPTTIRFNQKGPRIDRLVVCFDEGTHTPRAPCVVVVCGVRLLGA
jgi:hypothetical protein